ncbi:cysteine methyltransferase [Bacterioplanes sanyensis]|uniref:methylated-DNA--[protein]-cysteine S-methyltransferase n=1 Tax=Bacterioplanes sanyensis TaxID=1249553 RepID=A0A222FNY2_9GAMM|nr:methylated-DNA--[protein]-cysteine S-methyltransferase [Bacterioplanes sanyensis]ASP40091.1 cysteine methyltransferase [Bacterioplanes sanyensis]
MTESLHDSLFVSCHCLRPRWQVCLDSPVGHWHVQACDHSLWQCHHTTYPAAHVVDRQWPPWLLALVANWEHGWQAGRLLGFPLREQGSPLQRQIWTHLMTIGSGEVRTYQQVADAVGKPKAVRAVANAIGRNPWWWLVPCHRVVGSDHQLKGYAGGVALKAALLAIEGMQVGHHEVAEKAKVRA